MIIHWWKIFISIGVCGSHKKKVRLLLFGVQEIGMKMCVLPFYLSFSMKLLRALKSFNIRAIIICLMKFNHCSVVNQAVSVSIDIKRYEFKNNNFVNIFLARSLQKWLMKIMQNYYYDDEMQNYTQSAWYFESKTDECCQNWIWLRHFYCKIVSLK